VAAGIPFEVIPGISSAIAVPAYAGIPVTQRQMAQSFTVVTGHTSDEADPSGTNWADLPRTGTLVLLMGVRHLPEIVAKLIEHGRDPHTPSAAISWGTTPQQTIITDTLQNLPSKAETLQPPSIIVVGEVVALHQQLMRNE
jgi:uroporphyrinogen III methyltransferase / synthase